MTTLTTTTTGTTTINPAEGRPAGSSRVPLDIRQVCLHVA